MVKQVKTVQNTNITKIWFCIQRTHTKSNIEHPVLSFETYGLNSTS